MSTAAFRDWVKAGRPWRLCQPVAEYRAQLIAGPWDASTIGTIGDEAHLTAEVPQDHCPFSVTGWPGNHPYPLILAIDVMDNPSAGRDVNALVAYWIGEARLGHTPWVKYVIWRGQRWDVRNNWSAVSASGHFDHAHVSFRTDYALSSVGSWQVLGRGNPVSTTETGRNVWNETIGSPALGKVMAAGEWLKYCLDTFNHVVGLEANVAAMLTVLQAIASRPVQPVDPQQVADALAANEAFVQALAAAVADQLGATVTEVSIAKVFGKALSAAEPV